jgi:hypothetical protein
MPIVDANDPTANDGQYNVATGIWLIKGQVWRESDPGFMSVMSRFDERKEVRLGYGRPMMLGFCENRARLLVAGLELAASDRVLLVGSGFGWLAECLEKQVPGLSVVSLDTSTWVQATKGQTETADIEAAVQAAGILPIMSRYAEVVAALDDGGPKARVTIGSQDVLRASDRAKLKQAHGNFSWAITETMFTWLDDAECVAMDAAMHKLATNVAHMVQPYSAKFDGKVEPEPVWNWKYLEATGQGVRQQLLDQPWYTTSNWKGLLPNSTFLGVGGGVV